MMKLIISDISGLPAGDGTEIICDRQKLQPCIGCFGCWVKTPAQCVLKDGTENMGALLSRCDELLLISKCTYGGYSPFVKNVVDRSISYVLPDFTTVNGEMHHKKRYEHNLKFSVYFYGPDITAAEKETAEKLVKANAVNFYLDVRAVRFFGSEAEVKAVVL